MQVLFLQGHSTCFGRKRPSSEVFKTSTAVTGTCVIVAGKSSHLLIRAGTENIEWLCRNKTCTVLHQVGVSFELYYDARKHKIKISVKSFNSKIISSYSNLCSNTVSIPTTSCILYTPRSTSIRGFFFRFLDHTKRRTTVGRTPLDEWSARRRYLYLTTNNTHNRKTSMPAVGLEPTISANERPQTYALDRAATGTGHNMQYCHQTTVTKENAKGRCVSKTSKQGFEVMSFLIHVISFPIQSENFVSCRLVTCSYLTSEYWPKQS